MKRTLAILAPLLGLLSLSPASVRADLIRQSSAYSRTVLMTSASDHVTGATGLTLVITESKAGAAYGSVTPTVTELGNGLYAVALTSAHTGTLGALDLHVTASGADPSDTHDQVVAFDPTDAAGLGLTRLDAAVSSRSTFAGGAVASVTGAVGSVTGSVGGNVTGSVGSVTGAVGSVTGGVTVSTVSDKTGYSLATAPPTLVQIQAGVPTLAQISAALPTDYQQRGVAVTLPASAPTGYGGVSLAQVQALLPPNFVVMYVDPSTGAIRLPTAAPAWAVPSVHTGGH